MADLPQPFMIYARAANGVIGKDGTIPWHIPADLRRFKQLTMGHAMIMGRKTFESFPAPLPGRRHIVLTRARYWEEDGAEVARSRADALQLANGDPVAIVGGTEIYRLFEQDAERIELTEVHAEVAGDTFMHAPDQGWKEISRQDHPASDRHPAYSYVTFVRAAP